MSDEKQVNEGGELDVLLATEQTFPPPPEFVAQANASDPGIYERADADPEAWWGSWAEKLDWIEPFDEILDWSEPPFAKWFTGGKLNVSANCLDRHVAAGAGDRVAYSLGGRGRHPQGDHLRLAARADPAGRQRTEVARRRQGRRGRHLHADDPRGRGRDARLHADRRGPQRRLRRLLGRLGRRADGDLRRQGADHRRRDPPSRQADADEGGDRRGNRGPRFARARDRRRPRRHRPADERGPGPSLGRADRGGRRRSARRSRWTPRTPCSSSTRRARPRSRRGSSTPPPAI